MKELLFTLVFVAASLNSCAKSRDPAQNSISTPSAPSVDRTTEIVVPGIPKDTWEAIYFGGINNVAKAAEIGNLRELPIGDKDIEVRVWGGFGLTGIEGFVLKRVADKWSGKYIRSPMRGPYDDEKNLELKEPAVGWEKAWTLLVDHKILSLPDDSELDCGSGPNDGYSYVVEIKKGEKYRTYQYDNPAFKKLKRKACKEVDEILSISEIISKDYGASGFHYDLR